MNIKTIAVTTFLSLLAFPVFAMDYPTFAGITISSTTTAAEYIIYFFNLAVAMGTLIAVVMVIMAGIEWVTSSGNPGKIESAKGKIANTLLGVAVLLGCYLILNTINPQLTTIQIDNLNCDHGIVLSVKQASDGKINQVCIDSSQNITDTVLSTVKWNFPDKYLLKVYAYAGANYTGAITEFNCKTAACSGSIPTDTKSIYFLLNSPGIYLYDDNSYTPANPAVKSYPLFTSTSIADLSKTTPSFDNFTKSLDIISPTDQQIQYMAIVFKDPNWQGKCAFVAVSVPDMDQARSGSYTDSVGDNSISSIIVTKANLDQSVINEKRGEVILYTKTTCGKSDTDPTKQIKSCHIPILSASGGQIDIGNAKDVSGYCTGGSRGDKFVEGDEVMSFEITGAAGLVLSTKPTNYTSTTSGADYTGNTLPYCMYFDKASLGGGTCYSNIQDSPIFTVGGDTPKSFIVLPDN
jgi:hypothetical protein